MDVRGGYARKSGPWTLDLGGIAKGYAVDRAAAVLRRGSPGRRSSGAVNAGGDLRVWGEEPPPLAARIPGKGVSWVRPFVTGRTAAATSSVRTRPAASRGFRASDHVEMPSEKPLREAKTVTVFADRCLFADALTKIVLLGSTDVAARCLSRYGARALVFGSDGALAEVIAP